MTLLENKPADIPVPREITTKPRVSDRIFRVVVTGVGALSVTILTLIAFFLASRGLATFREEGLGFITGLNGHKSQMKMEIAFQLLASGQCLLEQS